MNRVDDMPLPENFRTDLLLVIVTLLFFIFSAGKATPTQAVPELIIAPP